MSMRALLPVPVPGRRANARRDPHGSGRVGGPSDTDRVDDTERPAQVPGLIATRPIADSWVVMAATLGRGLDVVLDEPAIVASGDPAGQVVGPVQTELP